MNTNHIIAKVSEIFFFSYLFTYFGNFYVWGFKLDFYDESFCFLEKLNSNNKK